MPSELEGLIFSYFFGENRILGCLGGILEASWVVLAEFFRFRGSKLEAKIDQKSKLFDTFVPKRFQDAPRRPQDAPKMLPDAPRPPQTLPNHLKPPPDDDFGAIFGRCCVILIYF